MLYLGGDVLKKFFVVFVSSLLFFFSVSFSAFATPALTALAPETVTQLLVALGLISGDSVSGYDWRVDSALGQEFYTTDIFGHVVPKINSGDKLTEEDLKPLYAVFPDDLYWTDGSRWFVGSGSENRPLNASDLYLEAKSLVGINYSMPVNLAGAQNATGLIVDGMLGTCEIGSSSVGSGEYFFPYAVNKNTGFSFFRPCGVSFPSSSLATSVTFSSSEPVTQSLPISSGLKRYLLWSFNITQMYTTSDVIDGSTAGWQITHNIREAWIRSDGKIMGSDLSGITDSTMLYTSGYPVLQLQGNSSDLNNVIVEVKPSNDDDDNQGSTPPAPVSPNNWEVWKTLEDLTRFLSTGENTNNGTTFGDFVNNNYNYVDVDINLPDNVNVNLGGGLDISGSGDINVNVNENISVPSVEGEGDKFYNLTLWDSLSALVADNPMITAVSALVRAIDPQLVALCSVSISLIIVLAIWRFIRGG